MWTRSLLPISGSGISTDLGKHRSLTACLNGRPGAISSSAVPALPCSVMLPWSSRMVSAPVFWRCIPARHPSPAVPE